MSETKIHQGQPLSTAGKPLSEAKAAMILVHGRGGGVESILPLTNHFEAEGFAYLAPAAKDGTWYPNRFLAPRKSNEPFLSSALETVTELLKQVKEAGIPPEKTILLGFSQGACLALEVAARNPQHYGAVVALSGGLIGADDELNGYIGSFKGSPIFIGCSDIDTHIPVDRIHQSVEILQSLGAEVEARIYKGMGHTVNQDEIDAVNALMKKLV
jgi:phospholipase/carboxylesterase